MKFPANYNFFIVTTLCLLSLPTWASDCRINPNDPFEPNASLTSGAHAGECVQTENYRSYRILNENEVAGLPALQDYEYRDYLFIANLQHQGKFWLAVFEKSNSVARYVFLAEHFPPEWLAAHTEFRVDFKPEHGPLLFLQTALDEPPLQIQSIVLSNEAVPYRGGPEFNIYYGVRDDFAFGNRLISLDDIVQKTKKTQHTTEQFVLHFTQDPDPNSFLNFDLNKFNDPSMSKIYNTLNQNCSNSLFESFDEYLRKNRTTQDRVETTLPLTFKETLKKRGLIDENSEQKTLNEEFGLDH